MPRGAQQVGTKQRTYQRVVLSRRCSGSFSEIKRQQSERLRIVFVLSSLPGCDGVGNWIAAAEGIDEARMATDLAYVQQVVTRYVDQLHAACAELKQHPPSAAAA